jgi:hypothetical protein
LYFGLIVLLAFGMKMTHLPPETLQ